MTLYAVSRKTCVKKTQQSINLLLLLQSTARQCQQKAKDFTDIVVALKDSVLFQTSLAESELMKHGAKGGQFGKEGSRHREKNVRNAKQRA